MAAEQFLVNGVTEIIKKVLPVIAQQISSAWGVKDDLRKLKDTLESIQALISDAEKKQVNYDTVKLWLGRLKDVVYDADDVMDEFAYETMRRDAVGGQFKHKVRALVSSSNPLVFKFKMARKIRALNGRLEEIYKDSKMYQLQNTSIVQDNTTRVFQNNRLTSSVGGTDSILQGREAAKSDIIKILIGKPWPSSSCGISYQPQNVSALSIVGMGGLGKTTLAQMVYNDDSIVRNFELRAWVCVSHPFDIHKILRDIIESITRHKCENPSNVDVPANQVKENLIGKKYLLVLDDLWNDNATYWENLKSYLSYGGVGSKILVTTRSRNVASVVGGDVHDLEKLSKDACWSIEELAGLNSLRVLEIRKLENVRGGIEDGETAKLKDKQHLRELHLEWGSTGGDDDQVRSSRSVKDTAVLEGLQPHSNLKHLHIYRFSGLNLPKWMMGCSLSNFLPNLVKIIMRDINNCEQLPALGMLQFLRYLGIFRMKSIKCLGEEFYYQQENKEEEEESSSSDTAKRSSLFPSLVDLSIELENLEEWVAPPLFSSSCFPSLETMEITNCKRLKTIPIISFSSLKTLNLTGTNDNMVNSLLNRTGGEGCLPSLTYIEIWESPDLIYLPPLGALLQRGTPNLESLRIGNCSDFQGFRDDGDNRNNNTSFQSLRIYDCPVLASLPDLQLCTSIHSLWLEKCPVLTSLPDLRLCTSLRELIIWKCDKLKNKESIPYDLKKSLTFLEDLRVDFIQRDEGVPDVSSPYELTNLMEKKKK